MSEMSKGLASVREIVSRETVGAVSPPTQLGALYYVLQQHHTAIADLMSAVRRNRGALAPDDAFRMILSLREHATMAGIWLQLARPFRNIPREGPGPDMSVAKSNEQRMSILRAIRGWVETAFSIMDQLVEIQPPTPSTAKVLDSIQLSFRCIEVQATVAAWNCAGGKKLSTNALRALLEEPERLYHEPAFPHRREPDQDLILHTLTLLYDVIGDQAAVQRLLRQRRSLPRDFDSAIHLYVDLLNYGNGDTDRLEIIRSLIDLERANDLGPLFSRERVGRLSIARMKVCQWSIPTDMESSSAPALIDAGLEWHDRWSYAMSSGVDSQTVRIGSDWGGRAVVQWGVGEDCQRRAVSFDPWLGVSLSDSAARSGQLDAGILTRAVDALEGEIAPLLRSLLSDLEHPRLAVVGPLAMYPLLSAAACGEPLGAIGDFAFRHPNPDVSGPNSPSPVDLVVVDRCFGRDSQQVISAVGQYASSARLVTFDSRDTSSSLDGEALGALLSEGQSALLFCHVDTPLSAVADGGIPLGPDLTVATGEVAQLSLSGLENLALIGCASGRSNPYVGDLSVAHAAAVAGAVEVLFTMWPITSRLGGAFA